MSVDIKFVSGSLPDCTLTSSLVSGSLLAMDETPAVTLVGLCDPRWFDTLKCQILVVWWMAVYWSYYSFCTEEKKLNNMFEFREN